MIITANIEIQRTSNGWLQLNRKGETASYMLGTITDVVGTFEEINGRKAVDLLFPDMPEDEKINISPTVLKGLVRRLASQETDEAKRQQILGYLEPVQVDLLGMSVQVPNMDVSPSIFEKAGMPLEDIKTGRGGYRNRPVRLSLGKGLGHQRNLGSVEISIEVDSLVASRKVLGAGRTARESLILQPFEIVGISPMISVCMGEMPNSEDTIRANARARARAVSRILDASGGEGSRSFGLTSASLDEEEPTSTPAAAPATTAPATAEPATAAPAGESNALS